VWTKKKLTEYSGNTTLNVEHVLFSTVMVYQWYVIYQYTIADPSTSQWVSSQGTPFWFPGQNFRVGCSPCDCQWPGDLHRDAFSEEFEGLEGPVAAYLRPRWIGDLWPKAVVRRVHGSSHDHVHQPGRKSCHRFDSKRSSTSHNSDISPPVFVRDYALLQSHSFILKMVNIMS